MWREEIVKMMARGKERRGRRKDNSENKDREKEGEEIKGNIVRQKEK